jgi:hypothetical protein
VIKVPVAEMSVDLCRPYRLVSQELVYRSDVARSHHELAHERVSPGVQARVINSKLYQLFFEPGLQGIDQKCFRLDLMNFFKQKRRLGGQDC